MKLYFLNKIEKEHILIRMRDLIGFPNKINQEKLKKHLKLVELGEMKKKEFAELIHILEFLINNEGNGYDAKQEGIWKRCQKRYNYLYGEGIE